MKKVLMAAAVLAIAVSSGCRRSDVRDFEVSIPSLAPESEQTVRNALARFGGVEQDSLAFDRESKTLRLRYDSMQLAKKNIEIAIAKAGLEANGVTPASVGRE